MALNVFFGSNGPLTLLNARFDFFSTELKLKYHGGLPIEPALHNCLKTRFERIYLLIGSIGGYKGDATLICTKINIALNIHIIEGPLEGIIGVDQSC